MDDAIDELGGRTWRGSGEGLATAGGAGKHDGSWVPGLRALLRLETADNVPEAIITSGSDGGMTMFFCLKAGLDCLANNMSTRVDSTACAEEGSKVERGCAPWMRGPGPDMASSNVAGQHERYMAAMYSVLGLSIAGVMGLQVHAYQVAVAVAVAVVQAAVSVTLALTRAGRSFTKELQTP